MSGSRGPGSGAAGHGATTSGILGGPFAWHGDELESDSSWRFHWSEPEIAELAAAARAARDRGLTPDTLTREQFPVPRCVPKLERVRRVLEHGRGLALIRGLPVDTFAREELELVWMGICTYLGTPVFQNARGERLRLIRDEGALAGERYGQLARDGGSAPFLSSRARTASTGPLRFHTDRTDVVALLCNGLPRSGGTSLIASSVAVHNAMMRRRPELARLLYQPLWRSRLGEEEGGEALAYPLPVWAVREGRFTSHYSRTYVEAAQLLPQVPRVSESQWAALDLLAELAETLSVRTQFELGDIQLLNSHVTYHARTAFENDPAAGLVRSLYRIWLCAAPEHRALPLDHAVLWQHVERGELRGGIRQAGTAIPPSPPA